MSASNEERKSLGLPVRQLDDPMANVKGDEQNFRYAIITPVEPFSIATYERIVQDNNGGKKKEEIKRNVPRLVATMALGNLNSKEVALARVYAELALMCAWNGYDNIAINYFRKWEHLCVISQSHYSHLLDKILSETVQVTRKEESLSETHDSSQEKGDGLAKFIDKWKNKDSSQFTGGVSAQGGQQFGGLR